MIQHQDVQKSEQYAEETVGSLMDFDYICVPETYTVGEAFQYLRKNVYDKANIHYSYVIDSFGVLVGVLSLRELLGSDENKILKDIMSSTSLKLDHNLDQEKAAKIFQDSDLVTLPVIDSDGRMIGVLHVDEMMDVLQQEATEDIHKMASISVDEDEEVKGLLESSMGWLYKKRIGWLVILVFVNLLSGAGIASYEDLLNEHIYVVFFLPLLIASGGNTGSQSTTLVIRAMAVGDVTMRDWRKVFMKEAMVSFALGLTMAAAIAVIGYYRGSDYGVGMETAIVIALSMVIVVMFGGLLGAIIPFVFRLLNLDPATASTPLITSICDIAGVFIYLGIASMFLQI
ncbi:magnesium transporter [Ignatzschineria sp. LJL83]